MLIVARVSDFGLRFHGCMVVFFRFCPVRFLCRFTEEVRFSGGSYPLGEGSNPLVLAWILQVLQQWYDILRISIYRHVLWPDENEPEAIGVATVGRGCLTYGGGRGERKGRAANSTGPSFFFRNNKNAVASVGNNKPEGSSGVTMTRRCQFMAV